MGWRDGIRAASTPLRCRGRPPLKRRPTRRRTALTDLTRTTAALPAPRTPDGRPVGPTNPFVEFARAEIEQSIPARFEQQVRRYPDRLAVKAGAEALTYAELNRAANRLARTILARRGLQREPLALLFEHG